MLRISWGPRDIRTNETAEGRGEKHLAIANRSYMRKRGIESRESRKNSCVRITLHSVAF